MRVKPETDSQPKTQAMNEIACNVRVEDFKDYREYLEAVYRLCKQSIQGYSYLRFAADLGFAPTNVIRLTINRHRDLSEKSARRIAKSINMNAHARQYFLNLVKFQTTRNDAKRDISAKTLTHIHQQAQGDAASRAVIQYFSHWYNPVIREFIRRQGLVKNLDELIDAIFPRISRPEVDSALEVLSSLGYIRFDSNRGGYTTTDQTDTVVPSHAIANHFAAIRFHSQMLEVSHAALNHLSEKSREINSMTLVLSVEGFELLRFRMREFLTQALALEGLKSQEQVVVQLNSQIINLTNQESSLNKAASKQRGKS